MGNITGPLLFFFSLIKTTRKKSYNNGVKEIKPGQDKSKKDAEGKWKRKKKKNKRPSATLSREWHYWCRHSTAGRTSWSLGIPLPWCFVVQQRLQRDYRRIERWKEEFFEPPSKNATQETCLDKTAREIREREESSDKLYLYVFLSYSRWRNKFLPAPDRKFLRHGGSRCCCIPSAMPFWCSAAQNGRKMSTENIQTRKETAATKSRALPVATTAATR